MQTVVAYIRLTDPDPDRERQMRAQLLDLAAQNNMQVDEVFNDSGVPAAVNPFDRPAWKRMLDIMDIRAIRKIIVGDLGHVAQVEDRLTQALDRLAHERVPKDLICIGDFSISSSPLAGHVFGIITPLVW